MAEFRHRQPYHNFGVDGFNLRCRAVLTPPNTGHEVANDTWASELMNITQEAACRFHSHRWHAEIIVSRKYI